MNVMEYPKGEHEHFQLGIATLEGNVITQNYHDRHNAQSDINYKYVRGVIDRAEWNRLTNLLSKTV